MIRDSLSIWQFTMRLFWLTSCKERKEKKSLATFSVKSMLVAQGYFVFFFDFLRFFLRTFGLVMRPLMSPC